MGIRHRAITLIEVLIVALVLCILAAVVAPQFSRAGGDNRTSLLRTNLLDVRAQLRLYRTQHENQYPSLDQFAAQLSLHSSADGRTNATQTDAFHLGPYLPSIPVNPFTGGNRISNGSIGSSDWYYDPDTGLFRANHDAESAGY